MKIVQKLGNDGYERKKEFCEIMTENLTVNPNFVKNICFSVECTVSLNGRGNKHNVRYWSDVNQYSIREDHTQVS